jgi:S1/P1 Nuclease
MPRLPRLLLALLLAAPAAPSFAWNGFGHMVVADIAWRDLKAHAPQLLARLDALLQLNPSYAQWVKGVPESARQEVAFVQAAHWADDIKSSTSGYVSDGDNGGNTGVEPVASRNLGYAPADTAMHKYWHFVDAGFATDGTPVAATPMPNVQERIVLFSAVLASPTGTDALKSYDLSWLIHLVGDLHQPLHATERFTADALTGDAGGNFVKVSCSRSSDCPRTLHAVWDDILGNSMSPTTAIDYAATLPLPADAAAVQAPDDVWAAESLRLAESDAYAGIDAATGGDHRLSGAYLAKAERDAKARVALAGLRLSWLIQNNLR